MFFKSHKLFSGLSVLLVEFLLLFLYSRYLTASGVMHSWGLKTTKKKNFSGSRITAQGYLPWGIAVKSECFFNFRFSKNGWGRVVCVVVRSSKKMKLVSVSWT